jgi:amidase
VVTSQGQGFPGTDGHDIALGVVGPMARNGEDLALLLDVTLDRPLVRRERAIDGARFLYLEDHPLCPVDDAVRAPIEAVVEALEAAGAAVDRRSALLPDLAEQHDTYMRMLQIALFKGAPGPQGQVASAADWLRCAMRRPATSGRGPPCSTAMISS